MRVRLVRKLAEILDGVDVSACEVGQIIEVTPREADLLLAEGWVEPAPERTQLQSNLNQPRRGFAGSYPIAQAADLRKPRSAERLREIRQQMDDRSLSEHERRRVEDAVREELRDSRAKTVTGNET